MCLGSGQGPAIVDTRFDPIQPWPDPTEWPIVVTLDQFNRLAGNMNDEVFWDIKRYNLLCAVHTFLSDAELREQTNNP